MGGNNFHSECIFKDRVWCPVGGIDQNFTGKAEVEPGEVGAGKEQPTLNSGGERFFQGKEETPRPSERIGCGEPFGLLLKVPQKQDS